MKDDSVGGVGIVLMGAVLLILCVVAVLM